MNVSLLCCSVALAATPTVADDVDRVFGAPPAFVSSSYNLPDVETVVRGQNPGPMYGNPNPYPYPGPAPAPGGPFAPMGDPFLNNGPVPGAIIGPTLGTEFPDIGVNRIGPARLGWDYKVSVATLSDASVQLPGGGNFSVFEWDNEFRYTWGSRYGLVFSVAQEYDMRSYSGPDGATGLSNNVHHIGWDFELSTPRETGPWGFVLGFNPSINTDFELGLSPRAWNWDGRGYLTYSQSPHLTLIGGVAFWDRVQDRILPYAGVIWKPTSRWEFHLTVPEGKIVYFLGNGFGRSHWLYARAEFHVEAYEVETGIDPVRGRDKFEVRDYRIVGGWAMSNGWVDGFVEVGAVVDRHGDFQFNTTSSDFGIQDGFFGRLGLQF